MDRDPYTETPHTDPWTETHLDKDPLDRDPLERDPLDRDPLDRTSPGQRPPLDRDPPPPQTETPCMVKSGQYASYWNAFLFFHHV